MCSTLHRNLSTHSHRFSFSPTVTPEKYSAAKWMCLHSSAKRYITLAGFSHRHWAKDTRRMWPMCSVTPQHEWAVKHERDSPGVGSGVAGRTGLRGRIIAEPEELRIAEQWGKSQMKSLVWIPQLSGACNDFERQDESLPKFNGWVKKGKLTEIAVKCVWELRAFCCLCFKEFSFGFVCVCVCAAERWQAGETSRADCVDTSRVLCLSSK